MFKLAPLIKYKLNERVGMVSFSTIDPNCISMKLNKNYSLITNIMGLY